MSAQAANRAPELTPICWTIAPITRALMAHGLTVEADMFIRTTGHALIEFARDMRLAVRSLSRAKGLAATIIVTLGLGIGANAAIFSVVRGVLLRPLVNRGEEQLIYIRQA